MTDQALRFDRAGNEIDSVQDKILAWVSLAVVLAVAIGGVAYYNFGMNRTAASNNEPSPVIATWNPPAPGVK
jgi:hypothetical protein